MMRHLNILKYFSLWIESLGPELFKFSWDFIDGNNWHVLTPDTYTITPLHRRLLVTKQPWSAIAILWGPFLLKKALFSETEKCHCFPCSSIIYCHLMFSPSYFKGSLSTILIKSVNSMPLWDFLQSHFEVVFKMITIAELFIVVTTSSG